MATASMTMAETGTHTWTPILEEPRRDNGSLAADAVQSVGITINEHDRENEYLDSIPATEAIQSTNPRSIRQFLRLHPIATVADGSAYVPHQSSRSELVNILVLEQGDIITRRRLRSVDALRHYLRYSRPARRLYLVSSESLSDTVVGLLGSSLDLNPDLFALFLSRQDLPLSLSIPSSIAARQIVQFNYYRIDNNGALHREHISFSMSQGGEESWTGLLLLSEYELNRQTAAILRSNLRETVRDQINTLFDAIPSSMEYSTYIQQDASTTLAAVIYSVFPLIVSESAGLLSEFASSAQLAERTIEELSLGNLSDETRLGKLEWLQNALDNGYLRSSARYEQLHEVFCSMQRAMHDCDVLHSRLPERGSVDTELIRDDLTFLTEEAQRLQRENDTLLSKRDSLLGLTSPNSSTRNDLTEKQSYSPGASGGAGGPPDPPNPYSWNRRYGEHIITKIDQIAYMTNILLSLSFIASVYGMNLNIFNGGQVELSQYLATALPFCFVVFIVTFVIPGIVVRMLPGKQKRRAMERGFKVDIA
ncbi:hypothetical protein IFM61392_06873 [Aspergillus lentulus]|uniref:Uncharacterized protein n=1 Tax=Aspergillus lentulus TaxID=293939 RepID=A0AAN5YH14_ASPLE|nr:hypothetical protein CNMCM6069_003007 [Aspergillus lentulus]KAF4171528.1 hypothetical protein CNMCM8060_002826 [Aspergillus lentulus]KAF4177840.1 hypothetical protein CNMCM7927_002819 [Aspergillus lentulus]KAF4190975.1 hypothetical protein CNMCM8694_002605 [Aspergillus lentulus]KAF4200600.1 hypothetical protein CNMCM8927_002804 [Aspergillus lentulus]